MRALGNGAACTEDKRAPPNGSSLQSNKRKMYSIENKKTISLNGK